MMKKLLLIILLLPFICLASEKRILIMGDSLTEGYGVASEDAYPNQLEVYLKKNNHSVKVINAGSSGSTSASAKARLRWHLKVVPDILILALGANDGLRGIKPEATKSNLDVAIKMAKEKGITTYLAGMKMPYNYGKEYRQAYSKIFKELVTENKIKEIPFLLKGVGGVKELNLADGIHPNEKGHQAVAKTVASIIESDL